MLSDFIGGWIVDFEIVEVFARDRFPVDLRKGLEADLVFDVEGAAEIDVQP